MGNKVTRHSAHVGGGLSEGRVVRFGPLSIVSFVGDGGKVAQAFLRGKYFKEGREEKR